MSISMSGRGGMLGAASALGALDGPAGPPSGVDYDFYAGTKISYFWTNYDNTYYTEYSLDGGVTTEGTFGPGVARWDSGSTILQDFAVRHLTGGQYSIWVPVSL